VDASFEQLQTEKCVMFLYRPLPGYIKEMLDSTSQLGKWISVIVIMISSDNHTGIILIVIITVEVYRRNIIILQQWQIADDLC